MNDSVYIMILVFRAGIITHYDLDTSCGASNCIPLSPEMFLRWCVPHGRTQSPSLLTHINSRAVGNHVRQSTTRAHTVYAQKIRSETGPRKRWAEHQLT